MSESNTTEKIWVINDDDSVRSYLETACEMHGFETDSFPRTEEAIELLKKGNTPDAILCDMLIRGGMSGAEFYEISAQYTQGCARFILSALSSDVPETLHKNIIRLLKPISSGKLGRHIKKKLGKTLENVWVIKYNIKLDDCIVQRIEGEGYNVLTFDNPDDAYKFMGIENVGKPDAVIGGFDFPVKYMAIADLFLEKGMKGVPRYVTDKEWYVPMARQELGLDGLNDVQVFPDTTFSSDIEWRDSEFDRILERDIAKSRE